MALGLHEAAARNNAEWCAVLWRAHGLAVERSTGLWFCSGEAPPLYPNAVTVDPNASRDGQIAFIAELAKAVTFPVALKDSFARLPLANAGFVKLFGGTWLCRIASRVPAAPSGLEWRLIDAGTLGLWEAAWSQSQSLPKRIFIPDVLNDRRVYILAGLNADGVVVAGVSAFAADGFVGLTNIFGEAHSVIAEVRRRFPGHRLVAYEQGSALQTFPELGFTAVGPLTVWSSPGRGGSQPCALVSMQHVG